MSYPENPGQGPQPSPWANPAGNGSWQAPPQQFPAPPYSEPQYPNLAQSPQPYYIDPNATPYGSWTPTPPRRHGLSTGVKVLLILLPIVVVVGVGAFLIGSHHSSKTPAASATTSPKPTANAGATATPTLGAGADKFTLPATAAGLPLSTDPSLTQLGKAMASGLGGFTNTPAVVGVYQSPTDQVDLFYLIGLPHAMSDPDTEARAVFTALENNKEYAVGKQISYPTGAQGGSMYCASSTISEAGTTIPMGICSVADHGGLIMTLYFKHSGAATATATTTARKSFER